MLDLRGIIPALMSPCDGQGNLDLKPLPKVLDFLLRRGAGGLFVGGSTGEGFFLGLEERRKLTEVVLEHVDGRVPVVIHVGSMNFREAIDLARHAGGVGADAVASVTPFYYHYQVAEIRDYYQALAEAAGCPLIIYSLSGVSQELSPEQLIETLLSIQGLYGIKFSHPDLAQLQRLRHASPEWLRFYGGWDSLALPMFVLGVTGIIGSNYSSIPELWVALYRAFCSGDLRRAVALQQALTHYTARVQTIPAIARTKGFLKLRGIDVGTARLPLSPLSIKQEDLLREVLEELRASPLIQLRDDDIRETEGVSQRQGLPRGQ